MNKIKFLTVIAAFTLIVSCEDAIDITQPNLLDAETALQTVPNLQSALGVAYGTLDHTSEIHFTSVFTDEIRIAYSNGGQGRGLYSQILTADDAFSSTIWVRNYQAINRVNRIIAAAERIDAGTNQAAEDLVVGEARAIRAYLHFNLLSYLSTDLTSNTALGVPILDFVPATDYTPLRNTNQEVYDFIEADLIAASTLITRQSSVNLFSKDAVTALRARIAAYKGDYITAETLASGLLPSYPLATPAQYDAMFADTGNAEVIFKMERRDNDRYDGQGATGSSVAGGWAGASFAFSGPDLDGAPYYEMALNLWNSYEATDLRRDNNGIAFNALAEAGGRDVYIVNKYRGSEGVPLMNDLKIFRSSDLVLIRAEAAAEANRLVGPNSVASNLADLRTARYGTVQTPPVVTSTTAAWALILAERRKEFAFEGFRYLDLRRLGNKAGGVSIDRATSECALFNACSLSLTDFRYTAPIPQDEFNANPGLRAQQNPGY